MDQTQDDVVQGMLRLMQDDMGYLEELMKETKETEILFLDERKMANKGLGIVRATRADTQKRIALLRASILAVKQDVNAAMGESTPSSHACLFADDHSLCSAAGMGNPGTKDYLKDLGRVLPSGALEATEGIPGDLLGFDFDLDLDFDADMGLDLDLCLGTGLNVK